MQFSMNNLCRYLLLPVITSNHIRSGDKGIRTLDPLLARQVLSQLSYTPGPSLCGLCSAYMCPALFF